MFLLNKIIIIIIIIIIFMVMIITRFIDFVFLFEEVYFPGFAFQPLSFNNHL